MFYKLNPFFRYGSKFLFSGHKYDIVAPDCRLLYVNKGAVYLKINKSFHTLREGDVFFCPAGVVYRLDADSSKECMVTVLNFDLTDKNCNDILPRTPLKHIPGEHLIKDAFFNMVNGSDCFLADYKIINNAEKFSDSFENILNTFQSDEPFKRELSGCMVKTMLLKLNSYKPNNFKEIPLLIKKIIAYINENYTENIDNDFIAELVGYHPNYIGRVFKEYMQISLHQYVLDLRISKAKKLIAETDLSFKEIADISGFRDYPYFSAYFRQKNGVSPAEFRKQNIRSI